MVSTNIQICSRVVFYTPCAVLLMVFKGEGRPHIQSISICLFNIQFKNPEVMERFMKNTMA